MTRLPIVPLSLYAGKKMLRLGTFGRPSADIGGCTVASLNVVDK